MKPAKRVFFILILLALHNNLVAAVLPQEVTINGVEFILVPEGEFLYTIETGVRYNYLPNGTPYYRQVNIWLPAYYLAKHEASATDLARFMNSLDASNPLRNTYVNEWTNGAEGEQQSGSGCTMQLSDNGTFIPDLDMPATYLSWNHAQLFAQWMGFRLPTEAEWQKAARSTDNRIWPWGNEFPDDTVTNFSNHKGCVPQSLSSLPQGRSYYGHYHMAGNVSEYTQDWFNEHWDSALTDNLRAPALASTGSAIPHEQPQRISKGGRWSHNPAAVAIGFRHLTPTEVATNGDGVRFAIDAQTVENLLIQNKAQTIPASPLGATKRK